MDCERSRQLSAYHDGELPVAERAALEAHVAECAVCRGELAQLGALSRLLAQAGQTPVPSGLEARLHERIDHAGELVVVRLAERLMAVAAAVLVACGLYLWQADRTEAAAPIESWERTLISQRLPAAPEPAADDPVIRWVVADLSEGEQE
jgi:anti-sigma factor RsiW